MSRIGKMPVVLPQGVDVVLADDVSVKGALGALTMKLSGLVQIKKSDGSLEFSSTEDSPQAHAMVGTTRALVANMVRGVSQGFERKLVLVGVGYRAQGQGDKLNLSVGYSHPVVKQMPQGIKVETPVPTEIILKGIDAQVIGQVAAEIRAIRPPEPYKGKGIRYENERVIIKEAKKK